MNATELQKIEQRLKEGYYEGDPDTLRTMQALVRALRSFREEAEVKEADDSSMSAGELK
jgi:hypothetical protein